MIIGFLDTLHIYIKLKVYCGLLSSIMRFFCTLFFFSKFQNIIWLLPKKDEMARIFLLFFKDIFSYAIQ